MEDAIYLSFFYYPCSNLEIFHIQFILKNKVPQKKLKYKLHKIHRTHITGRYDLQDRFLLAY